jgi:hypothetical protein
MIPCWVGFYPCTFIRVLEADAIEFEIQLGWGLRLTKDVEIAVPPLHKHRAVFMKRRIENILATANQLALQMYWGDPDVYSVYCDVLVDGDDLVNILCREGYF